MEMITMILSGLALLAAGVSLILTFQEKKRNEKRNAAALQYTDKTIAASETMTKGRIDGAVTYFKGAVSKVEAETNRRLHNLESGICPDFEEAKAAAKAVNDFNAGLSAIMNFDPMEEARKARERAKYGEAE